MIKQRRKGFIIFDTEEEISKSKIQIMSQNQKITLSGAGLAGSLLAIYLAKKGFEVEVYEKRPDMRKGKMEGGRSINLALSNRGIQALEYLGIAEEIMKKAIPMRGRMLHALDESLTFVPYGKDENEYINSISRSGLNIDLMNIADSFPNVNFYFNQALESVDFETKTLKLRNTESNEIETAIYEVIIGTDGGGSALREAMMQQPGFEENIEFLEHGYKELSIPAMPDGGFFIEKNALHIWPRGSYMLIALPNLDGSFTCTLFFPNKGEPSFESLDNEEKIKAFFQKTFPDSVPLLADLVQEFAENPVGLLGTVRCFPWHVGGEALLLGDSAHAIVPFYGQGMNASFEDCFVLNQCIEKFGTDWEKIFSEYEKLRKINTDAIAELAVENFYEMRDGVAEPAFLLKKQLETIIENTYGDYHSKYSLVTFHPEIPYAVAHERGNKQNEILLEICRKVESIEELDIEEIYRKLKGEVGF